MVLNVKDDATLYIELDTKIILIDTMDRTRTEKFNGVAADCGLASDSVNNAL